MPKCHCLKTPVIYQMKIKSIRTHLAAFMTMTACCAIANTDPAKPILDYGGNMKNDVLNDDGLDSNHGRASDVAVSQDGASRPVLVFNGKTSKVETSRSVSGRSMEILFQPEKGSANQVVFHAAKKWSGVWANQRTLVGIDADGYVTVVVGFGTDSGQEPAVLKLKTPVAFGTWNHLLVSMEENLLAVHMNGKTTESVALSLPPCDADIFTIGCIHDNYIASLIDRSKNGNAAASEELAGILKGLGISPADEDSASYSGFYIGKIARLRVWDQPLSDAAVGQLSSDFSQWREE